MNIIETYRDNVVYLPVCTDGPYLYLENLYTAVEHGELSTRNANRHDPRVDLIQMKNFHHREFKHQPKSLQLP